ncbi:class 1 fructose-bisphosphatase [Paraburkholderia sp. GAS42]|jgi:fructose-1,6-bisphosphatase|uniref:class 1 fructose-bisphosphatase n=1 Tax=Paraburkholderia sp. GAS42 TaxID=3035135 RepID=UPI003D263992
MTHIASTEHITLSSFFANAARDERAPAALVTLIEAVADACSSIATAVERGVFDGASGNAHSENVHGEAQKKLDVVSNDIMIDAVGSASCLRGLASEELESVQVTGHGQSADTSGYLLLFDPLDGSSNLEINGIVGSIFSVLAAPASGAVIDERHFLQPGVKQVCAGYAIYGATTMFVLTTGHGVDGFTFDRQSASFVLTHPQIQIPENTREFAINMSNERYWEAPVRRYVRECVAGASGPRQTNFNMRWIASMVAEVHRILMRGGVFLYPRDNKNPQLAGRLRLTYEANPMSFIVEQAGGLSTTGETPIMEVQPDDVHQRVPVILGSRLEVERLLRYHDEVAAV